jgi:hypothetical protein
MEKSPAVAVKASFLFSRRHLAQIGNFFNANVGSVG